MDSGGTLFIMDNFGAIGSFYYDSGNDKSSGSCSASFLDDYTFDSESSFEERNFRIGVIGYFYKKLKGVFTYRTGSYEGTDIGNKKTVTEDITITENWKGSFNRYYFSIEFITRIRPQFSKTKKYDFFSFFFSYNRYGSQSESQITEDHSITSDISYSTPYSSDSSEYTFYIAYFPLDILEIGLGLSFYKSEYNQQNSTNDYYNNTSYTLFWFECNLAIIHNFRVYFAISTQVGENEIKWEYDDGNIEKWSGNKDGGSIEIGFSIHL